MALIIARTSQAVSPFGALKFFVLQSFSGLRILEISTYPMKKPPYEERLSINIMQFLSD